MKQVDISNKAFAYALIIGLVVAAIPDMACAQGVAQVLESTRSGQLPVIVNTMNAVFYIVAFGFTFSGAKGLKDHTENPSTKLAPQIAKLAVGGLLAAAPAVLGSLTDSWSLGADSSYVRFSPSF